MANSPRRVLLASLAGTTIEFFDFYIYATAAVLVFPREFFPAADPAASRLQSLATFGLAFLARPIGSVVFGHFGDRIGRKSTLVAALLTMGISTLMIGLLPTYSQIGVAAPLMLALCRIGQGLGLGGEWGGAVLLATENAPPERRAWYGMFPQLGAPLGFLFSGGIFLVLSTVLTNTQFLSYGWRWPFLASSVLVLFGLWVRLKVTETPAFAEAMSRRERVEVPVADVVSRHGAALLLGTFSAVANFVLFYVLTVFTLSWGTSVLGYGRERFLILQLAGILFFAAAIPLSALWAERRGGRSVLMATSVAIVVFAFFFGPWFRAGLGGVVALLLVGYFLMGLTYGPLGTYLSELFPTAVRYTGASLAFNFAGILGASAAPAIATKLGHRYGLDAVGGYVALCAIVSLLALAASRRTAAQFGDVRPLRAGKV